MKAWLYDAIYTYKSGIQPSITIQWPHNVIIIVERRQYDVINTSFRHFYNQNLKFELVTQLYRVVIPKINL